MLNEALTYINGHVAPTNIVSFSVFEDDHPCPTNHYHVVVYHKGDGLETITKPDDVKGELYQLHQFESDSWEGVTQKTEEYLIAGGSEFKHLLSTFNYSHDNEDTKAIAVITWNRTHEDLFADLSRGGCQCLIF